ncbi:MAG: two-component system, chemotaxis family, chemotaxis protein CheY [Myxococcales bacterium]|nr:two-component system, chemotaxis family, chemotaxis protein CheY [Myxococcales bacterium]
MKRVLVIDDSSSIREQVRNALTPGGYDVLEAYDGLDGLEKIRTARELDLVLCDLNMPRMGGLELIIACQKNNCLVPFLILTSDGQPSVIRRARDAGVKGWIVKPIKGDLLRFAVDKVLGGTGPDLDSIDLGFGSKPTSTP